MIKSVISSCESSKENLNVRSRDLESSLFIDGQAAAIRFSFTETSETWQVDASCCWPLLFFVLSRS